MPGSPEFKSRPIFARVYARLSDDMDARGAAEHRRRLLAGVSGRVVEVGAGNGHNFAHYPAGTSEVLAVEPEPHLRAMAEQAASSAPARVEVVEGSAERIPAADESCDVAVASLMLCTVPDQAVALAEIQRVLRPGGELRFYEHVVSRRPRLAALQRTMDATFWPLLAGGCHCARDTAEAIADAGFVLEREERFPFKALRLQPPVPHILGVARRTALDN